MSTATAEILEPDPKAADVVSQDWTFAELKQLAKRSLYFLAKWVLGYDKLDFKIHGPLCALLQNRQKNRKKIVLPRGWYKTTVISIAFPIFLAINDCNVRILLVQNTFKNAVSKLSSIDQHFKGNDRFRALFPELIPNEACVWRADSMCVKRTKAYSESTFEAAGTGTQVVSRHYDYIIEDDTVAPDLDEMGEESLAPSPQDIEQAIGFHRSTLGLLNDPSDTLIVVGTRWYVKDLLSWIDDNEGDVYSRYERAVRETDGRPDPRGQLAWPERFPEQVLVQMEKQYGPYLYACLCLNTPVNPEDMLFRKDWFRLYVPEHLPKSLHVYTTVDVANDPKKNKGKKADYNVVCTCGKDLKTGLVYVLECDRIKGNPGEVIDLIFQHFERWKPIVVGIESVAYQSTLQYWVEERMRSTGKYFNVEAVTTGGRSKHERIMGLQPVIKTGSLLFLHPAQQWLMSELESYPLGVYDDGADALAANKSLWDVTAGTEDEQAEAEAARDPHSLAAAKRSIQKRYENQGGILYDVLTEPTKWV